MLQAKGEPSLDAEGMLDVYLSSLKLLEDHEWKLRQQKRARLKSLGQTGKGSKKKPRQPRE